MLSGRVRRRMIVVTASKDLASGVHDEKPPVDRVSIVHVYRVRKKQWRRKQFLLDEANRFFKRSVTDTAASHSIGGNLI